MSITQLGLPRDEPISPWTLVFTGFAAAEFTAYLLCGLPAPSAQGWGRLAVRAVLYVAAVFGAGVAGTRLPVRLLGRRARPGAGPLTLVGAPAWLLFPAIAVLFREDSLWLPAVTAVGAWLTASGLERLSSAGRMDPKVVRHGASSGFRFRSVYGLPGPEFHPATKFLMALSVAGALLFGAGGLLPFASMLLAAAIFLGLWRWRALTDGRGWHLRNRTELLRFAGGAMAVTFLSLALWRAGVVHDRGGIGLKHAPAPTNKAQGVSAAPGYLGIVLLPPKEKNPPVSAPIEHLAHAAGFANPLVIPFDGAYWYFQAPSSGPGQGAHVTRGRSTEVNVRSIDGLPVQMQAHQVLGSEIDVTCCREIALEVTNAEDRAGEIALQLMLTDRSSPKLPSLSLGQETLQSSLASERATTRGAVKETLHFAIPPSTTLHQFDQIDVIFRPSIARARTGARVSIDSFTLVPR